ncbi:WD40 repeat-like protein, partial [Aspergillus ellipticus CBS 707.79]
DNTIRIWDSTTGATLCIIRSDESLVTGFAFSSTGKLLVCGYVDSTIKVWDTSLGSLLRTFEDEHFIKAVAFSANDKMMRPFEGSLRFSPTSKFLTLSCYSRVWIWDCETGSLLHIFPERHSTIIAFSPDSKQMASLVYKGAAILRDPISGSVLRQFEGHDSHFSCVAFSPDNKRLALGYRYQGEVRIWDVETSELLNTHISHSHAIKAVALPPDGNLIAFASEDHMIQIWDLITDEVRETLKVDSSIQTLSFSETGLFLNTDKDQRHASCSRLTIRVY